MRRSCLAVLVMLAACSLSVSAQEAPVLFVSAQGNDEWSGKLPDPAPDGSDGPVGSLVRARDLLRGMDLSAGAMVYVRAGVYYLREPLVLEKQDSGVPGSPVVWQAWPGEAVRFSGGAPVLKFEPHKDAILKADVSTLNLGGAGPHQLFMNGDRQIPARWPNRGDDDMPGGKWAFVAASVDAEKGKSFVYGGDRPGTWGDAKGVEVSIWPNYNWWQTIAPVAVIDAAAKKVTLDKDLPYTIEPGRRFFFQNILAELDAPGEWYLDRPSNTLYFWPPAPVENAEVVLPAAAGIVRMSGVTDLAWMGFTMEAVTGDAVAVENCERVLTARGVVRNTGGFGVTVRGGKSCKVAGCDIYATGRGGIVLEGGDRKSLTPAAHEAVNNHIHHFANLYQTYETAVNISGVGNRIAHNLIHDAPHIGILLTGNDHIIEYNDVSRVCMEGSDNGAFYMGRDWTQRGNVIRFNKFHDIYGFGLAGLAAGEDGKYHYESPHQAWGVYLDDCSSGTTILGNIFYRVPLCGVMIGGGRDNVVENNIFVDSIPALHIDDRWDGYCWDLMKERLEAMDHQNPPYSTRYPELLKMGDDPRKPANNRFVRNIVAYTREDYRGLSTAKPDSGTAVAYNLSPFDPESTEIDSNVLFHPTLPKVFCRTYKQDDGATVEWLAWQERGFDKQSELADPRFIKADEDDYSLRNESPALKLGFKAIQDTRIGLYRDEFRASWPPPQTEKGATPHKEWAVAAE